MTFELDIDTMRDVYMSKAQRDAYERIVELAKAGRTFQLIWPPGWKLVPVEPTAAMLDAGEDFDCSPTWRTANVYRAMIAAAPTHDA